MKTEKERQRNRQRDTRAPREREKGEPGTDRHTDNQPRNKEDGQTESINHLKELRLQCSNSFIKR